MKMDTHSKNVCLIGILHFLFYSMGAIRPLVIAYNRFSQPSSGEELMVATYFISMAALAALMIRGVISKQHKLLAPFLAMSMTFLVYEILIFLSGLIIAFEIAFRNFENISYRIAITTISVYTIYTLYWKLRLQYMKEKSINDLSEKEKKKEANVSEPQLVV